MTNQVHDANMRALLDRLPTDALVAASQTERSLAGKEALGAVLAHAKNIASLNALIKSERLPVKLTYQLANLDYQVARHALWVAQTVEAHNTKLPGILNLGPSKVLLLREAERRFAREGTPLDLVALLADLEAGVPRSELRRRLLPTSTRDAVLTVLTLARAGRWEPARQEVVKLSVTDRNALAGVVDCVLAMLDGRDTESPQDVLQRAESASPADAPSSLHEALQRAAGGVDD